ncbi:MAG: restriction endonuclease subunit S [Methylococcales bacterium]|nr:restriction endonuclease subunit S [Methylococcales bacterium]
MNTTNAAMQESGVEWIGVIPQGWKVKIIKRDFDIKLGKMLQPLKKTELDTEEYYLKTSNIYWDGVDIGDIKKMWFSPLDKANTELQYNDLLVCEGGDVGRSTLWKEEITPCYIQNAINRVRPIHNASTKYLYYWLFLLKHSGYIDAMVSRITIAHLTAEKLERLVFLLPPCSEQQAIAQYLDERCGKLDKIIAIKQQQIKTLDALRQSIIYQAVTKGLDASVLLIDSGVEWLGEIPKNWKLSKLRYEISIKNGDFISNKLDHESEYPVVGGNGFMGRTDSFNVKGDIIVIGRVGAYCGNVHYINEKAWVSDNALIVDTINNKKFFTYLLNSFNINSIANKTAQPVVTATNIKAIYIPIPTFNEQQAIAAYLDQETQRLDQLKANLNQQIKVLSDYKKSLIYECVTGKKRVIKAG